MPSNAIGRALRDRRIDAGLSVPRAAALARVDWSTIYRIESGRTTPRLDTVTRLVTAYRMTRADRRKLLDLLTEEAAA